MLNFKLVKHINKIQVSAMKAPQPDTSKKSRYTNVIMDKIALTINSVSSFKIFTSLLF